MMNVQFYVGLMVVFLATSMSQLQAVEQPATKTRQDTQAASPDELAIRAGTQASAKAFNAGDAKTIAARWTEDGDYVNQDGQRYVGRDAIQQEYEKFFAEYPGVRIQFKIDSVRMLSPETAIVEGTARVGTPSELSSVSSHFESVQVKRNGKWMIASARDLRTVAVSHHENVADFEKLIGKWKCEHGSTIVTTTCRWIGDKKYLERKYVVSENGTETASGTQIIGWNPVEQQITSWLFDSTGGHDFATWTPRENGWVSQSNGYTADGEPTTATNLLTHVDVNSMTWNSINRSAGDQRIADTKELVLKRVSKTGTGH